MARILICDDEPGIREEAAEALGCAGYEIRLASDGRDALKQAREAPVDLILLDIVMPMIDGLETMAEIRGAPDLYETPKIVATSCGGIMGTHDIYLNAAKCLGADRVLPKPFWLPDLLALVAELLDENAGPGPGDAGHGGAIPPSEADCAIASINHHARPAVGRRSTSVRSAPATLRLSGQE